MTSEERKEMLINELRDVLVAVTDKIKIRAIENGGQLARFEVMVNAPTYYLTSNTDNNPKPTNEIIFYVDIPDNYPVDGPHVYYLPDKYLASINVFRSGIQDIGKWEFNPGHADTNTTLVGIIRKTVMDIIHEPSVSWYDSMANSNLENWQKEKTALGELPSCRLSELFKTEEEVVLPKLPVRTPPVLPARPTVAQRTCPTLSGGSAVATRVCPGD